MAEKIVFYEVGTDKRFEDYFPLDVNENKKLYWKNFGQKLIIKDGEEKKDVREYKTHAHGDLTISKSTYNEEFFEGIDSLYDWYINAYDMCYSKERGEAVLHLFDTDLVRVLANSKWDTRRDDIPEQDYYFWEQWEHMKEYAERTNQYLDDAITCINNWRRPKLATNAPVKLLVIHNEEPRYVGILENEKRKTVIDASFRLLYTLEHDKDWRKL